MYQCLGFVASSCIKIRFVFKREGSLTVEFQDLSHRLQHQAFSHGNPYTVVHINTPPNMSFLIQKLFSQVVRASSAIAIVLLLVRVMINTKTSFYLICVYLLTRSYLWPVSCLPDRESHIQRVFPPAANVSRAQNLGIESNSLHSLGIRWKAAGEAPWTSRKIRANCAIQ